MKKHLALLLLTLLLTACGDNKPYLYKPLSSTEQPATIRGEYITKDPNSSLNQLSASMMFWDKDAEKKVMEQPLGYVGIIQINGQNTHFEHSFWNQPTPEQVRESYKFSPGFTKLSIYIYGFTSVAKWVNYEFTAVAGENYHFEGTGSGLAFNVVIKDSAGKIVAGKSFQKSIM